MRGMPTPRPTPNPTFRVVSLELESLLLAGAVEGDGAGSVCDGLADADCGMMAELEADGADGIVAELLSGDWVVSVVCVRLELDCSLVVVSGIAAVMLKYCDV
jgi:hypothetical protein